MGHCRRQQPGQQAEVQRSPSLTRCRDLQQRLAWRAPLVREEVRLAWGWVRLEWWVWSWMMLH